MKFRPLHDRVVVRRIEEDERTRGGIIIPDTAKEKPQQGEIVAVGGTPHHEGERHPRRARGSRRQKEEGCVKDIVPNPEERGKAPLEG